MANVSYLRTPDSRQQRYPLLYSERLNPPRRSRKPRAIVAGLLLVAAAVAAGVIVVATSSATVGASDTALAAFGMPLGGGTIAHVSVTTGPHSAPVPVVLRGDEIWPRKRIRAGTRVSIEVVVRRPSWISWLTGATQRVTLSATTPSATLRSRFLTVRRGAPPRLTFDQPVRMFAYGQPGHFHRVVLSSPQSSVTLPFHSPAGSTLVRAAPRSWESAAPEAVSWFPAGLARASAVVSPSPGSQLGADQPISLTFSKPVAKVLGSTHPALSPATAGSWHIASPHTLVFQPSGYGYGLGATVKLALPAGVGLVGGHNTVRGSVATFSVPRGSTVRLQQLLAQLGYLPVGFTPSKPVAATLAAQLQAAQHPPAGNFSWRYQNVPVALRSFWAPGASGVMTRGAVMAFESDHGFMPDGVAGPLLWKTLITAAIKNERSSFGYTFVSVSEASQRLTLWHNGRTILSTPVNTGIASAPTAKGTFPVFEHLRVTTMSGTNPDGSHYSDPGVPYVSYFNGGDALHGFYRAQYGFPQSLGCVEMPVTTAGKVWPYTPVGTLVHVY